MGRRNTRARKTAHILKARKERLVKKLNLVLGPASFFLFQPLLADGCGTLILSALAVICFKDSPTLDSRRNTNLFYCYGWKVTRFRVEKEKSIPLDLYYITKKLYYYVLLSRCKVLCFYCPPAAIRGITRVQVHCGVVFPPTCLSPRQ